MTNRYVIDIGNTTIATAMFADREVIAPSRINTKEVSSLDDVADLIQDIDLRSNNQATEIYSCAGVSNIKTLLDKYALQTDLNITYISGLNSFGIDIDYNPAVSLGPDRIANAIAVNILYDQPTLIIDCGTAITIDLVDDSSKFVGGIIAPGLQTSKDALTQFAPALPSVDLVSNIKLIETSTVGAIRSGIINSAVALINFYCKEVCNEIENLSFVITGGDAELVLPSLSSTFDIKYDQWLTLYGLGLAQAR